MRDNPIHFIRCLIHPLAGDTISVPLAPVGIAQEQRTAGLGRYPRFEVSDGPNVFLTSHGLNLAGAI